MMESASVVVSRCENALRGIGWLGELEVVPAALTPLGDTVPAVSTRVGGVSVFADGVYRVVAVCALEPAEVDPLPDDVDAPAPVVPDAAFAWMKIWSSISGVSWNCGCDSRIT